MNTGSFYVMKGFVSLPFEDKVARTAYLEELPTLAECLVYDHFRHECELILKSIAQFPNMVVKFTEVMPKILAILQKEQCFDLIYLSGDKFCISAENKSREAFLKEAESELQKIGDFQLEFNNFLKPQLLAQISDNSLGGKFALWRLARLTVLKPNFTDFEDLVFKIFSGNETSVSNASEVLCIMRKNLASRYLVKALMSPDERARINAINAIEQHSIDTNEQYISVAFESENDPRVLDRIAHLPVDMITEIILKKLINTESTSSLASSLALSSKYFKDLLPILKEKGGVGCEINRVSFNILKQCNPIPYDFLSMLLKESKEIMKESTIEDILSLDEQQIMVKLIFPRMNEKGNWRSRYNAVQIVNKFLERAQSGKKKLDKDDFMNFAGFVVAMGLDHVYSVREANFKLLRLFPPEDARFVIDSYISIVSTTDDFQKQILKEFLEIARDVIVKSYDRKKIEDVMKKIDMVYPHYFDVN